MAYMNVPGFIKDHSKVIPLNTGGNRACYRLNTIREYLDGKHWKPQAENASVGDTNIRRWRFGEHLEEHKINKTILLVGQTGSGKTTLINTMVNYVIGVKFEDKVWFQITEEEQKEQTESQTSSVTVYQIHIKGNPVSLTIIDTPGYGDTRGQEHDKAITDNLQKLFESYGEIDTIHAVGLVVKSSENRLTDFQTYIFNSVLSLFGADIENNIVILMTYSDGFTPVDAIAAIKKDVKCAKDKDGDPVYFLFNNRQCEKYKENQVKQYEGIWSSGKDSMDELFKFLQSVQGQSLKMTGDVLKTRKQAEACLGDLMSSIELVKGEEKELNDIKKIVKENKENLDNNQNFTFEIERTVKEKVPIKDHFKNCDEEATCCDKCKKNCHFPGCTWVKNLYWCSVMSRGKCTVCECSYKDHVKQGKLYMPITRKVRDTDEGLKKKYKDIHGKSISIQQNIEKQLQEKKGEMSKLLDEAFNLIMRLDEIALQKEPLDIRKDLDVLIQNLRDTNQLERANKLEEIQNRAVSHRGPRRLLQNLKNVFSFDEMQK